MRRASATHRPGALVVAVVLCAYGSTDDLAGVHTDRFATEAEPTMSSTPTVAEPAPPLDPTTPPNRPRVAGGDRGRRAGRRGPGVGGLVGQT